jgi:tRNA (guanine37-N1)-methyltransferase
MKKLKKECFAYDVTVPALQLLPKQCSVCTRRFRDSLLKQTGIKRFIDVRVNGKDSKLLLLSPKTDPKEDLFGEDDLQWMKEEGISHTTQQITLTYSNFTMNAILRSVLPANVSEVPTAFETVGHIAHLNIRDDILEYKTVIGEVLLDKHPHIRTVVNKLDSIDSSFRFFKMEVLAGEDDMIAKVKENGCIFEFDFSKVYWNSRLHSEHHRLTTLLKRDEVVVDMFAGVGPFALPAARKGCKVFANDLNPFSHQYLVQNAKLNHLQSLVTAYNQDGRQFVKDVFCQLIDRDPLLLSRGSHVIMNLPASAIEFLDSLNGILQDLPPHLVDSTPLPSVHCYTFTKSATPTEDVLSRVEHTLRTSLPRDTVSVHRVRDVAPNKLMMRVSFQLPHNVAFAPTKKELDSVQPAKRSPDSSKPSSPKRTKQDTESELESCL